MAEKGALLTAGATSRLMAGGAIQGHRLHKWSIKRGSEDGGCHSVGLLAFPDLLGWRRRGRHKRREHGWGTRWYSGTGRMHAPTVLLARALHKGAKSFAGIFTSSRTWWGSDLSGRITSRKARVAASRMESSGFWMVVRGVIDPLTV
eukprot:4142207-Amphidinium_carterae.2